MLFCDSDGDAKGVGAAVVEGLGGTPGGGTASGAVRLRFTGMDFALAVAAVVVGNAELLLALPWL